MPTRRKEKIALCCTSKGFLGAAAPKPVFAYFCLAAKVGRARGHEISPGRGVPETPCAQVANRPALSAGAADPAPPPAAGQSLQKNHPFGWLLLLREGRDLGLDSG